jgi:two-component system, OmpR family, sensor histidine kinase TctE
MKALRHPRSVRAFLLAGILLPLALFILAYTYTLYRNAMQSMNIAYDRMLIASAHSIGDLLRIENGELKVTVPYAALEIYEADHASRMSYRVNGLDGKFLSGDARLPSYTGQKLSNASYPELVHIYEEMYDGEPVRVAALFQPVVSNDANGRVLIQVAETIGHRKNLAQKIFRETMILQLLLLAGVAALITIVVSSALRPLDALRTQLDERQAADLSPLALDNSPRELRPVVGALNNLMERLRRLLDHQQRFVANASHQLRTPLAVLKTQLQSVQRGDVAPEIAHREMEGTVNRATGLANQLLLLAKVEQLRGHGMHETCDLGMLVRETLNDLSPLVSEKDLDFESDVSSLRVKGHPWMIGELISNLLHNAIRHTPEEGRLGVSTRHAGQSIVLCVWDSGPGISPEMSTSVFEPFSASYGSQGGGLGLTICSEIADSMGARVVLENRMQDGQVAGLNASVIFPAIV